MALLGVVALALGACHQDVQQNGPRQSFVEDHFSISAMPSWASARDRGSVVFHATENDDVIAVRAVALQKAGREDILSATERVLAALPAASLLHRSLVEAGNATAAQFDFTYQPPGRAYIVSRRHAVIIGARYIYHVTLTSKSTHFSEVAKASFESLLATIHEEA